MRPGTETPIESAIMMKTNVPQTLQNMSLWTKSAGIVLSERLDILEKKLYDLEFYS